MRLIGVGVGPGDPEHLTLKALRALREADRVFARYSRPPHSARIGPPKAAISCLRASFADSSSPKTSGKPPARMSASASAGSDSSAIGSNSASSAPAPASSSRFS